MEEVDKGPKTPVRCAACGFEINKEAKFCQECGAMQSVAASSTVTPEVTKLPFTTAERRQLTVLFCDLVGSSRLSTRLDAEDLGDLIGAYHDVAGRVVKRYGGHVAQYLGDGILIYFGYPQAFEDGAYRAVKTALDIVAGMKQLNVTLMQKQNLRLDVRLGLHTGQVVVGKLGSAGDGEEIALGDTTNIASRVQDLAAHNSVVITDATAELVARRFRTEPHGSHMLKGVPYPIKLYTVTAERTLLDEEIIAASTPLVNRDQETQRLQQALTQAREGKGGAVLMSGAAGIGKSRLVQFVRQQLDYAGGEQRMEFRCSPNHQESALNPFVEQLQAQCRFFPNDEPDLKLQKLRGLLEDSDGDQAADLSVFAGLLSLPPPPDAAAIDPQELKERTQHALKQWILGRQPNSVLLLLFEDVHWMDPSSLDVINLLIPLFAKHRCLLLMTCRPEFSSNWSEDSVEIIALDRLNRNHIEEIIGNAGGHKKLPATLVHELIDRADGVPIFAEELARNLMIDPSEQAGSGFRDLDHYSSLSIPSSLQDALMARLDKLNQVRGVAQIAAILGREFDFQTLLELTKLSAPALTTALDQLVSSDILLQSGTAEDAHYMFRHALLQEAAYNSLLRRQRNELHATMGEILERKREAATSEMPESTLVRMLAYHWSRAVAQNAPDVAIAVRAVRYLIEAGTLELSLSGYSEAQSQLNAALEQLERLPEGRERDEQELVARLRLSMVYMATLGWASDPVRDAFSACRDLCIRLGDRPELAQVLYGFWGYNLFRANYPKALELATEAHDVAIAGGSDLKLQTHAALANSHFWLGELELANSHAEQLLVDYDPNLHAAHRVLYGMDPGVFALMFTVWVPWLHGKSVTADRNHEELQRVMGELNHPLSHALALNTSCCFHVNRGDVAGAREAGEALLKLAQECGLPVYVMFGVLFRGWAIAAEGNVEEVIDEVAETYSNYVTHVGGLAQTYAALITASVFYQAGRIGDGIEVLDNAISIAMQPECRELAYHAELVRLRGELLANSAEHSSEEAREALQSALDLASGLNQLPFALRASLNLLTLAEQNNQSLDAAVKTVHNLLQRFDADEYSDEWHQAKARIEGLIN